MSNKIQIKRGIKANLSVLDVGEPAFTTDTKEFFIGDGSSNIEFAKQSDLEITNTQVSDLTYKTAGGTATAITLTTQTLVNGYAKTFIASASNGGAATTINGKPVYKPNTKDAPNLVSGKAYSVWYNSTGGCFFIKASAEGDADKTNVLAGKKFSNDNDTGLTGTMPNNGPLGGSLGINGSYNIPAGYTTGGTVNQSVPVRGGSVITPGTTNQVIGVNQWLGGDQTILGDGDLVASNILSTANIFGVQGSATVQSLGGAYKTTGKTPTSTIVKPVTVYLGYRPSVVLIYSGGYITYNGHKYSDWNSSSGSGYSFGNDSNFSITDTGFIMTGSNSAYSFMACS